MPALLSSARNADGHNILADAEAHARFQSLMPTLNLPAAHAILLARAHHAYAHLPPPFVADMLPRHRRSWNVEKVDCPFPDLSATQSFTDLFGPDRDDICQTYFGSCGLGYPYSSVDFGLPSMEPSLHPDYVLICLDTDRADRLGLPVNRHRALRAATVPIRGYPTHPLPPFHPSKP